MNENKKNIFKEITKWLIIICTTFVILSTSSLIFTSGILFGASHHDHVNNVVDSVFDNHDSTKKEVKRFANLSGTAVPNSGYVEKVYFNTSMSVEEVVSVLSNLTLNYGGEGEALLFTSNNSSCILCLNNGGVWLIYDECTGYCYFESSKLEFDFIGWNPDFNGVIEVNENVVSEIEGISIGTQNEAIKNLFSITPFGGSEEEPDEPIDLIDYHGSAVPNDSVVNTVFYNTKLSVEVVNYYLSQLTYDSSDNYFLFESEYTNTSTNPYYRFVINNDSNNYTIVFFKDYLTNPVLLYSSSITDVANFVGWNPDLFLPYIEIESMANIPNSSYGTQNYLLSNVFSTVPFLYQEGNNLPTSGFVKNIYFNMNLSDEEIKETLSELTFINLNEVFGVNYEGAFVLVPFDNNKSALVYLYDSTLDTYYLSMFSLNTGIPEHIWSSDEGYLLEDFTYSLSYFDYVNTSMLQSNGFPVITNEVGNIISTKPFKPKTTLELVFDDLKIVASESLKLLSDFAVDLKYVFYDFDNNELTIVGLFFALSLTFGVITALFALIRNLMIGRR